MSGQFLYADRVKDTSSGQSSSAFTLANSAPTGFQTFNNGIGTGNFTAYLAADTSGNWEVNYGTLTSSTSLARAATPLASSNSGSQVASFSGTVTVACVDPSAYMNGDIGMAGMLGTYYHPLGAITFSTNTFSSGNIYFAPVWIRQWFSSVAVVLDITVTGTSTLTLGLYNTANGAPNVPLGSQSGIGTGSTGTAVGTSSIAMPSPQPPGIYWIAYLCSTGTAPTVEEYTGSGNAFPLELNGVANAGAPTLTAGVKITGSSFPNPVTQGSLVAASPVPHLCVSVSL